MKVQKINFGKDYVIAIIILVILLIVIIIIDNIKIKKIPTNINNTSQNDDIIVKYKYTNPIVPDGFRAVETSDASWEIEENGYIKGWNDGLVIEDEIGNQFVWIPYTDNAIFTDNQKEDEKLLLKYSGFYISRYEAGLPEKLRDLKDNISEKTNNIKGIPVSKRGVLPWNYINVYNAVYNAEHMYPEKNNIKTAFMDSTTIKLVYKFFLTDYTIEEINNSHANISSAKFIFTGYYSIDDGKNYNYGENIEKKGEMLLSTGASEQNKIKNIYDFVGNVSDAYITRIINSGYIYANIESDNYKMNYGDYYGKEPFYNPNSAKGFRIVLYQY